METKVNYTRVGAFVILFGTLFILIAIWLSFGLHSQKYTTYLAYFRGSVSGLNDNAVVRYNGVPVGYVSAIHLVPSNHQAVLLEMKIESRVFISSDSIARLQSQGLTGIAYVELLGGSPQAPRLLPQKGEKFAVLRTEVPFSLNNMGASFRELLSPENIANISKTMANLQKVTSVFALDSEKLDILITNLSKTSEEMPKTIDNFNKAAQSLQGMSGSVEQASNQVSLTMQDGRVALQGLADQAMPETVMALADLRQLLVSIQQLNMLLQQNPAVLLRGKKPLPPGPGEKKP